MSNPKKFPKEFKTENSFKKFIKKNKKYILDILTDNRFFFREDKFICDSTLLIFAMRHALGRKTGAVNRVVEWILEEWNEIDPEDQRQIVKEILDFENSYLSLGYEWNRESWYRIVNRQMIGLIDETF